MIAMREVCNSCAYRSFATDVGVPRSWQCFRPKALTDPPTGILRSQLVQDGRPLPEHIAQACHKLNEHWLAHVVALAERG